MQGAFARQRRATTGLVARYGVAAILRRKDGDRPCLIFMSNFGSTEMMATPPDDDLDRLITFKQPPTNPPTEEAILRITEPPIPIAPNGEITFWRLMVRR
jgi:hypothetical protein